MRPSPSGSITWATRSSVHRDRAAPFEPHRWTTSLNSPGKMARLCSPRRRTPTAANALPSAGCSRWRSSRRASRGVGATSHASQKAAWRCAADSPARRLQTSAQVAGCRPQQAPGRPQSALQQTEPLAGLIQGLRVGDGHAWRLISACAPRRGRDHGREPLVEILAGVVGHLPQAGRDHQRPEVRPVSSFVSSDKIGHRRPADSGSVQVASQVAVCFGMSADQPTRRAGNRPGVDDWGDC